MNEVVRVYDKAKFMIGLGESYLSIVVWLDLNLLFT